MTRTETATDFGVVVAKAYATRGVAVQLGMGVQPVADSTTPPQPSPRRQKAADPTARGADEIGDFLTSSSGQVLTREVERGVFGMLERSL